MKLINESNGKTVSGNVRHARNFLEKTIGLIGRKKIDYALVFHLGHETRVGASIHSMFMSVPIDVLWLDGRKRVVDLKEGFKPWVLNVTPKKKARFIVELKQGTIRDKRIGLGHKINWV